MVDPKHTSKLHKNYLKTIESQLSWVFLQLPNLNPTEHLWGHFRAEEVKHPMTSQEALGSPVKSCWDNMSHQVCTNLGSPCQLECILALKAQGIPNTKVF